MHRYTQESLPLSLCLSRSRSVCVKHPIGHGAWSYVYDIHVVFNSMRCLYSAHVHRLRICACDMLFACHVHRCIARVHVMSTSIRTSIKRSAAIYRGCARASHRPSIRLTRVGKGAQSDGASDCDARCDTLTAGHTHAHHIQHSPEDGSMA